MIFFFWAQKKVREQYLQNEVHHPFAGPEEQLLETHTEDLPFQSVSDGVANAHLVANFLQAVIPVSDWWWNAN